MKSLFKSEEGKQKILGLYEQKLRALNIKVESIRLPTSFGETFIMATGQKSNPPIMLFHGSNGCAPIALETYSTLSKTHRVYAVDVLAQPNKSAETRLSMKDDTYGQWVNELIDSLNIDKVSLAGFSFGGLVILKTLEYNERKIDQVFLTAPAYIVNGNPLLALFKIFIPMKRFMKTGKLEFVEKFLFEVFTERDEFAVQFLSEVFRHFNMDFTPVPIISTKKAKTITTPISIFAAKQDVLFPGKKMIKRASKIFPSLKYSELLENSKHVQTSGQNQAIEQTILKLLKS